MMGRLWRGILRRFGQEVTLHGKKGGVKVRALVQPVLSRGEDQQVHSPLGLERREELRYFGPADHPLGPDTVVEWKKRQFRVRSAYLIGEGVCPCWRAVLYPRDEVEL